MPQYRAGNIRYTPGKQKRWMQKNITMSTASKALSIALQAKRLVNAERKYDIVQNTWNISDTGNIDALCVPAQGDAVTSRDGDSLKMMSIKVKGFIEASTSVTNTQVRCIVFRGKQENGVTFTVGDLLQATSSPYLVLSMKNDDEKFRTKILYDRRFTLTSGTNTSIRNFQFQTSKIKNPHIQFATASTNINSGGLYILFISNVLTGANVVYQSVVRYVDN